MMAAGSPEACELSQDRASSSQGSNGSTASFNRRSLMYSSVPRQPDPHDKTRWSKFLAAYQAGDWDSNHEGSRKCSKLAKKVQLDHASALDSSDFFLKYKYMAAPPAPREKSKLRHDTVARYGINKGCLKPAVDLYVKHAKSVFRCDYAAASVACTDGRTTLFVSQEGGSTDLATSATNTICDHAMLLGEDEVFVVSDLTKDWRFQHFSFRASPGNPMRFYASAPICLSSKDGEGSIPVQVGRLVIMRREPWPTFNDDDANVLLTIAKMTQDALENEYLHAHARKVQHMQRETALLSWQLNIAADEEITQDKIRENTLGTLICPPRMKKVVDVIREMLDASSATAVDVTAFHLQSPRSDSFLSSAASPKSSSSAGSYPSMPWLTSSTSTGVNQGSEESQSSFFRRPSSSGSDVNTSITSPTDYSRSDNSFSGKATSSQQRPKGQHSRSTSSSGSLEDTETYNAAPGGTATIIAFSGNTTERLSVSSAEQSNDICFLLTKIRRDKKLSKPQMYNNRQDNTSSEEDDNDDEEEGGRDRKEEDKEQNPLGSLMPDSIKSYCIIPIFANDRVQPLFLFLVTFDKRKQISESERLFMYSIGVIVGANCLRQQARLADRAQLDFIRSVQHELRTPLNGILGITDFLRQSLVSGDVTAKLDLTEDGLLASLLESIRLSGVNLSTILDDVLDFGAVSGLRSNAQTNKIEEIDLVREIEDGCLDELEHIAMHERQDQSMKVYRGYYAVPTLVIKVAPELQNRFRTDRAKVKKILSKFVANALRYSNEHELVEVTVIPSVGPLPRSHSYAGDRWIDFIIQDTGMGMSQEFVSNSLLKPFSKADSFSQGIGLGVTIAASLISQMGGRLQIQSELGKGTRVQFSLPFGQRPVFVSRNSLSQLNQPYQVKTASFFGFVLKGQKKIVEMIRERLQGNGIRIVQPSEEADLVILKETALAPKGEEDDQDSTSKPALDVPRPVGSKARILVVTRNALRSRNSSVLDGYPVWLFRPPFGPSSLDAMDEFLREESPVVFKSVPQPTPFAEDNMKKVQEKQQPQWQAALDEDASLDRKSDVKTTIETEALGLHTLDSSAKSAAVEKKQGSEANDDTIKVKPPPVESQKGGPAFKENPFRVLVVEDNYVNMRLITAVLTKGGYLFVEAKDGVEAVEQFKAFEPSVVLLDISLPLMDGFEACIQMRAHQMDHVPKIIAITALSSTEDKIKGLEVCGMDDWRTKPLSIKSLRTDLVVWKKEWDQAWALESGAASVNTTASATQSTSSIVS